MFDKPERMHKMLTGLDQKVRGQVQGLQRSPAADDAPPAERHDLTRSGIDAEHGKPVALPPPGESEPQGVPTGLWAEDEGESECRPVIGRIGVEPSGDITPRETGQTSLG